MTVATLAKGTGESISNAVFETLRSWGLDKSVGGMCFDTTASNTGRKNGACVGVETKLGRNLLHFPCRHHIFELVLEAVFTTCFGPSSGPDILIFKRFKSKWYDMNPSNFCTSLDDEHLLFSNKTTIIEFVQNMLVAHHHPRDDYKELLELVLIVLGELE